MKNSYYYLIASLPMLHFGMKPAFSYSDFLEECGRQLSQDEMGALKEDKNPLLKKWKIFDTGLRNELARTRAVKKGKDPNSYLRGSEGIDPFIAPLAHWAVNQHSPMDAEMYLDKIRWEKIEEIKSGHYFDTEYLAAYGLQLQILERWDRINSGDGMKILEGLTGKT
ncbi:MAG: DUF2764 family protein [Candidatus Omnitrophica bacterium]|nr:DUF2764 family protein [Candidatus Omnitrophota bacterium]